MFINYVICISYYKYLLNQIKVLLFSLSFFIEMQEMQAMKILDY